MKFSATRTAFQSVITKAALFTSPKNYALANQFIFLETIGEDIFLSAIGESATARFLLDDELSAIYESGKCLLPPALIRDIIATNSDKTFELESDDSGIYLYNGRYTNIPFIHPDDFKRVPIESIEGTIEVSAEELRDAIEKTSFACDTNYSSKYAICGVFFEFTKDKLDVVATDGRRLAHVCVSAETSNAGEESSVCIPIREVNNLAKTFVGTTGKIKIKINSNYVVFMWGAEDLNQVKIRGVEGQFPKWRRIIPSTEEKDFHNYKFRTSSFLDQLNRASVCRDEKSPGVNILFKPGKITMRAGSTARGASEVSAETEYRGEPLEVKFESTFLKDFLLRADSEFNVDGFFSPRSCLLRSSDKYDYVVMAMTK